MHPRCENQWFTLRCEQDAGHAGMCRNSGVEFQVAPPELVILDQTWSELNG